MRLSLLITVIITLLATPCIAAEWNVKDFGAVGDAVTDDTAAFRKALEEASKTGGIVNVPSGQFRINGTLDIPGGVTLQGTYRTAPIARDIHFSDIAGSVLHAYSGRGSYDGDPFINLAGNAATVAGLIIVYPEVKQSTVPPVPYPPCIATWYSDNVAVIDCNILNAYEAIRLMGAGRHLVRNVHGYPIWRGIVVDMCYDIGRIENVHFWPFGVIYQEDDPFCKWINLNGVAFEFARTDWQYVTNTFCFGYGVGYKFSESASGACNGQFLGIGADSCRRAVLVEQASPFGLLITNGEFVGRWGSTDSVTVEIAPDVKGKVSMNNCSFWGPVDKCITLESPSAQLTAVACNFLSWDNGKVGSPAIDLQAGRAILQGNTFTGGSLHVDVGKDVRSAIINGNQADGGLMIQNHAGKRTIATANEGPAVEWTDEAREHYRLLVGGESDDIYVRRWHGKEEGIEWGSGFTKRWSAPDAQLVLPVAPGREHSISLEIFVPEHALQPDAGFYLGDTRIIAIDQVGLLNLTGVIPASEADSVAIDIRCKNWVPRDSLAGSSDTRVLGIGLSSLTVKATDTQIAEPFNANTGE